MQARSRPLRRLFSLGAPILGIVVVFVGALVAESVAGRVAAAVIGSLLLLTNNLEIRERILPNDRTLNALRAELNAFIAAVRALNASAVGAAAQQNDVAVFHAACEDLVQRAQHIGTLAASTHGIPASPNRLP